MTAQEVKRKLAAILSADVKGYSRLMSEDEVGTIQTLNAYKEVMTSLIQHHRGRVVDAPGDNVLAEFGSVVDAVQCAAKIQKELKTRNGELPENRRMEFRIGVNLGDVIEDGEQILGDGVNIAARLESLSEAGGICISGTAFDQVKNKLNLGYKYLGEQTVKNIVEPVRVYRVLMDPEAAGKVIGEKKAKPRQWQMVALGLIVAVIVVIAAVVIWKLYTPSALKQEITFKEKITFPQPEKAPATVPPSTEVAPKEKVAPPSPEKVAKPTAPSTPKVEVASKDKMAFPLPDVPSIAVLPFVNMSRDPEQEYFSDGITETIITAFSKVPKLFVIARNSAFTYKGKPVKVKQVSEELGVRYVLEGSVQRSADRIRINAQLIDALTGYHIWAERYDRDLKDIFAIQDEITMRIITSLEVKLTGGGTIRVQASGTNNLEAYLLCLQANDQIIRLNKDGNLLAKQLAEKAIALDPKYPDPHHLLGRASWLEIPLGLTKDPRKSIANAMAYTQKALALDSSLASAHSTLGMLYTIMGQHDEGIVECEKAVNLEPNAAGGYYVLGEVLRYAGRHEEAIAMCQKAIRLNPFPPSWYYFGLTNAYSLTGQYEEAIKAGKKAIHIDPNNLVSRVFLAAAYSLNGQEEEARIEAKEVLRINPHFSVDLYEKTIPYKNEEDKKLIIGALRKAGLK
jgi:adenylate cyclase